MRFINECKSCIMKMSGHTWILLSNLLHFLNIFLTFLNLGINELSDRIDHLSDKDYYVYPNSIQFSAGDD